MKVLSTEAIGQNELKILIYGESGSGKTSLAKTIGEPTLIISAEAGLLPLRGQKIDVVDITRDDDGKLIPKEQRMKRLGEVYQYLLTDEAKKKYKWVFIDSLSELSQVLLEGLQVEFPERSQTLPMYGELNKRTRSLVKSFRDLPGLNVVFTALSEVEKDENSMRIIQPSMIGKFASQLPALLDGVYYLASQTDENDKVVRKLLTVKTERIVCKDRSGKLDRFEEPNLENIARKIHGKVEENKGMAVSGERSGEGSVDKKKG